MGKVDDNKKLKMNTLLQTAFDLFTGKGFAKTTVSDIVNQAGLAMHLTCSPEKALPKQLYPTS